MVGIQWCRSWERTTTGKNRTGETKVIRAFHERGSHGGCTNVSEYSSVVASRTHDYISIYLVHDDAKEKEFELEMSWIGSESNNLHVHVPKDLSDEAEAKARAALETFD